MKTNLMAAIAVLALGACASRPHKTLEQKLQDAKPDERRKRFVWHV